MNGRISSGVMNQNLKYLVEMGKNMFGETFKKNMIKMSYSNFQIKTSIMVWSCFIKNKLGTLVRLKGKMATSIYIEMLRTHLIPFVNSLENKDKYIFQEDNAPIHTAKIAKKWKEDNNIKVFHGLHKVQI